MREALLSSTQQDGVDKANKTFDRAGIMRLSQYLKDGGISDADFAEKIGVSGEAVRLYRLERRFPRPAQIHAIIEATAGKVTLGDLLPARLRGARTPPTSVEFAAS